MRCLHHAKIPEVIPVYSPKPRHFDNVHLDEDIVLISLIQKVKLDTLCVIQE
jgi:hypothetical protein